MTSQQLMEAQRDALDVRDSIMPDLHELAPELTALNRRLLDSGSILPHTDPEAEALRLATRMALAIVGLDMVRKQIATTSESN